MSKTPQRLSSIATPTRDKIVIYSAIAAGCGILALLGRHAAINRFGTDHFTGNVLFIVFLILAIGLLVGFQSMLEELFRKLPNPFRRQEIAIAETTSGEQIAKPVMQEITPCIEDVTFSDVKVEDVAPAMEQLPQNEKDFEITGIYEDMQLVNFPDGFGFWCNVGASTDEILEYKAYYDERGIDDEEYYLKLYDESLSEQERYDIENNITRVKVEPKLRNENGGCFTTVPAQLITKNDDGSTLIEEWEDDVFVTQDGCVYCTDNIDEFIEFYNKHKDMAEVHGELISQHHKCNVAFDELKKTEEKYTLEQVAFLCAYITHTMEQFMEGTELAKLHHNARAWTVNPTADFHAVQLRSDHLSKEDLKHLGYNVGKFLRLRGEIIARFVKHVFEEPFGTTHIRTIIAKLANQDPQKDRIPLLSAKAMDQLFAHYKRYGKINLSIIKEDNKK